MTQARRAKGLSGRGRRAWLLILVPLLMLLAGLLLFRWVGRQAELGELSIPGASTASASASPAAVSSTATASTPSPSAATPSGQQDDSAATAALRACKAKIKAADEVLAAAKTGMRNWSDHVQAQTDANAGKITVGEMEDIFDRTMKAGDKDEKRYSSAVKRYEDRDGSCREVSGASATINEQLARCGRREQGQEPVLAAAGDGMGDWIKHLGDMRRSEQGRIHNPLQKWIATWRAAPENINAYDKAADKFSAHDC